MSSKLEKRLARKGGGVEVKAPSLLGASLRKARTSQTWTAKKPPSTPYRSAPSRASQSFEVREGALQPRPNAAWLKGDLFARFLAMAFLHKGNFAELSKEQLLFVDTETTGLGTTSAQTFPFLTGIAWFGDSGALQYEQLFLPEPWVAEAAALERLHNWMKRKPTLVTFNGSRYDWPLLRRRSQMLKVPVCEPQRHLDVLDACRRVWRQKYDSLRLITLEKSLWGFERQDDIPGSEIPACYENFLRSGDRTSMERVMHHNREDLLSMVHLLGELALRFEACSYQRPVGMEDPLEMAACAKIAFRGGFGDEAKVLAHKASRFADSSSSEAVVLASTLLAKLAYRSRFTDEERRWLLNGLLHAEDAYVSADLHLSLAKLFEHRERDWERALMHAQQSQIAEGEEANLRRVRRLRSKMRGKLLL